jgi:hypothetical protein
MKGDGLEAEGWGYDTRDMHYDGRLAQRVCWCTCVRAREREWGLDRVEPYARESSDYVYVCVCMHGK